MKIIKQVGLKESELPELLLKLILCRTGSFGVPGKSITHVAQYLFLAICSKGAKRWLNLDLQKSPDLTTLGCSGALKSP